MSRPPLTMGAIAKRYGTTQRKVRELFTRGMLPEPGRCGAYRVVGEEDLPEVEQALIRAGHIKPKVAEAVPA